MTNKRYKFQVTLCESKETVVRDFTMPANMTFRDLHYMIQLSMGWLDKHLYNFKLDGDNIRITQFHLDDDFEDERYFKNKVMTTKAQDKIVKMIDPTSRNHELFYFESKTIRLDDYFDEHDELIYEYDFGDKWYHYIEKVEEIEAVESYAHVSSITGMCPPEDVGGWDGYVNFLSIMNGRKTKEYHNWVEWADLRFYGRTIQIEDINTTLKGNNDLMYVYYSQFGDGKEIMQEELKCENKRYKRYIDHLYEKSGRYTARMNNVVQSSN